MPEIPTYNAPAGRLQPSDLPEQSLQMEGRMAGRIGNEEAGMLRQSGEDYRRGLGELGQGAESLGNVVQRHQSLEEITAGAAGLSTTLDQLTQHYDQAAKTADPFDPNFSTDWRQNVMAPTLQNFVDQFKTPAGKEWAATHSAQIATDLYRHTVAADMSRAQDHASLAMNQTVTSLTNVARNNPTMTDTAVGMLPGTVAAIADQAGLSPEATEKLKTTLLQGGQKQIAAAGIQSAMEKNLDAGTAMANSPKYNALLTGQERDALIKHGESFQKIQEVQNRMIAADNRRQQKEAADQTLSQIAASVVQPNGQVVAPQNFATNIAHALTMPGSSPELGASMLKWGHAMAEDASAGKNDVTNDVVQSDFQTRAFLPPGDPKALTYKQIYDAKSAHQISNTDFARDLQMVGHNEKSDLNQQMESQMVHSALTQAAGVLGFDPTMPNNGTTTPAGQAYNRLLQWFTPAYQAAIRKGIAPSEAVEKLLTPERVQTFKVQPQANPGSGIRGFFFSTPAPAPVPPDPAKTSHDLNTIFGGH